MWVYTKSNRWRKLEVRPRWVSKLGETDTSLVSRMTLQLLECTEMDGEFQGLKRECSRSEHKAREHVSSWKSSKETDRFYKPAVQFSLNPAYTKRIVVLWFWPTSSVPFTYLLN